MFRLPEERMLRSSLMATAAEIAEASGAWSSLFRLKPA
jgi:hypothetical protein